MIDPNERLRQGAERILGITVGPDQLAAFGVYLDLLVSWNRVHRLVGSSERSWLVENVILDSLLFLLVMPASFGSLLDIGSGAGIPGIPIKIARPRVALVMAESRRKRASFLTAAVRAIGLTGVRVHHGRAEALIEEGVRFDVVVARCAGETWTVLDLGSQLVSEAGTVVVAGAPDIGETGLARRVRVVNPDTGEERTFLVQHGKGRLGTAHGHVEGPEPRAPGT